MTRVSHRSNMLRPATVAALTALLFGITPADADAADVTLAWDTCPTHTTQANCEVDPGCTWTGSACDYLNAIPDGYRLYYDTDGCGDPYCQASAPDMAIEGCPVDVPVSSLADPANPQVTITGLTSCQEYCFAVTAYNSAGESVYSDAVLAYIIASPNPVSASTSGPGALTVSWSGLPSNDNGSIAQYLIHYDTDPGEPYGGAGSPVQGTPPSHELTGLASATTYYVAVEAVCSSGDSRMSDEASGDTGAGTGGSGGTGGTGGTGGSGGSTGGSGGSTGGTGGSTGGSGGSTGGAAGATGGSGGSTGGAAGATGGSGGSTGGSAGATGGAAGATGGAAGATGGSGGSTAGTGGTGGAAGAGASVPGVSDAEDDGGCGCRIESASGSETSWGWAAALFALVFARRRR